MRLLAAVLVLAALALLLRPRRTEWHATLYPLPPEDEDGVLFV